MDERLWELVGLTMIGDGVLALLEPRRHVMLWRRGPAAWRSMIDAFAERPGLTRVLGATEAALGLWLAIRQMDRGEAEGWEGPPRLEAPIGTEGR